jgi:hypothetical protein
MYFDENLAAQELIDDSLAPFHQRLIMIYSTLNTLAQSTHGAIENQKVLQELQEDLNRLENGKLIFV